MVLVVDQRWSGNSGIGRYAKEVLPRLGIPSKNLNSGSSPASPVAALDRLPDDSTLFYSPGYSGLAMTATRQVLTVHDLIHFMTPWPGRAKYILYYDAFLRPILVRSGLVFTVSDVSRIAIQEWIDNPNVEVVNTGNGCSSAFSKEGECISRSQPFYLYVGNLKRHKNVRTMLRAFARTRDSQLVCVVRDSRTLMKMCSDFGISDRVSVVSGLSDEDLAKYYRGAKATILPSTLEGFGLPAIESLSCGTPVVYWKGCASVQEIVADRGVGVESSDDVAEWADALELVDPLRERYDPTSWDSVAGSVSATLSKVL